MFLNTNHLFTNPDRQDMHLTDYICSVSRIGFFFLGGGGGGAQRYPEEETEEGGQRELGGTTTATD